MPTFAAIDSENRRLIKGYDSPYIHLNMMGQTCLQTNDLCRPLMPMIGHGCP